MRKKQIGDVLCYAALSVLALYTLFPLFILFVNSFKSQSEIVANPLALPSVYDFRYISEAAKQIRFFQAFLVTAGITAASVGLLVLTASLAAWMMVRNKSKFSVFLYMCFTAAMLIPFQSLMYPLLRIFESMGLKNIPGLVLMYGGFGLSLSVFLYHGFIKSVPRSLEEAAMLDGASIFQTYAHVVFPLVRTTTATVIILNSMWIWNDYLLPFLVIGNQPVKTLTLQLYFAKLTSGQYGNPWELIFSAVLVTMVPIIVIFLFLQKYIVRGITEGAVKA